MSPARRERKQNNKKPNTPERKQSIEKRASVPECGVFTPFSKRSPRSKSAIVTAR
jgi:hypothetical protein